jgi:hypothetical protein
MTDLPQSRRDALQRAALAAGALATAGLVRPALAGAQSTDDEDLRDFLVYAIGLEDVTVLAYATAVEQAGPDLKPTLETFRDQEQAHANALNQAIDELGFDAPDPPDTPADTGVYDDIDGLDDGTIKRLTDRLGEIDDAQGLDQLLDLLLSLEQDQLRYYGAEGPQLDSEDLGTTAASIAGCQAQHLVALKVRIGGSPREEAAVVGGIASDAGDAATAAASQ